MSDQIFGAAGYLRPRPERPDELQALRDIRDLLEPPERWTKGAYARTAPYAAGRVEADSPHATCWCLEGACWRVTGELYSSPIWQRLNRHVSNHNLAPRASNFNDRDETTHRDILELLDKIIAEVIAERTAA
jgi:hypothetical protein